MSLGCAHDNEEFKTALRDVALHAVHLDSPYDRVRCTEWVRKLVGMRDDNFETAKIRNEYMQYLRIMVHGRFLHGPFKNPPPNSELAPLAECLGNEMCASVPYLPRMGPIAPYAMHHSPDGHAYIATKQIPGGGVFCYIAVTPDTFNT